jgi:hypothetical protein
MSLIENNSSFVGIRQSVWPISSLDDGLHVMPGVAAAAGTLATIFHAAIVKFAVCFRRVVPRIGVLIVVQTGDVGFALPHQEGAAVDYAGLIVGRDPTELAVTGSRLISLILAAGGREEQGKCRNERFFRVFFHGRAAYPILARGEPPYVLEGTT